MDEVNLLPWRVQKLAYERALLHRYLLFAVVLALLTLAVCHFWYAAQNAKHEKHLSALNRLLPNSDNDVERQSEPAEIATLSTDTFAALAATRAHGICYSKLDYRDHQITLTGQVVTLTGLARAIQQLTESDNFGNPHLLSSKQANSGSALQFVINTSEW